MYPDNMVSVGKGKKVFINKLESLRLKLQATPFIENTWHEQPVVDGSVEEDKRKFLIGVVEWKRTIFSKLLTGGFHY